jgi:hypothetical protein
MKGRGAQAERNDHARRAKKQHSTGIAKQATLLSYTKLVVEIFEILIQLEKFF